MKMPKYEPLPDGRKVKLLEDYLYTTDSGIEIVVAKGFVSDLASVPRIFWVLFPPFGKYTPAAIIHDWLYETGITSKKVSDKIFLELCRKCGVRYLKRSLMYSAVFLFGHPSDKYTDMIKEHEGLSLTSYVCPGGVGTIGYGHTNREKLTEITENKADILLGFDVYEARKGVLKYVKVPINRNELGALTSFVFNIGSGQFSTSTLLKKLNKSDKKGAADEFLRWNKAGGKILPGLTKRRHAERDLFLKKYNNVNCGKNRAKKGL